MDVVTTGDDTAIRAVLADRKLFSHVTVVNYQLCGGDSGGSGGDGDADTVAAVAADAVPQFRCPVSFVDTVEQLKWAHVAKHVGENVAYFEADMVIQPGAGDSVRKALASHDQFDIGVTYQPEYVQAFYDKVGGPTIRTSLFTRVISVTFDSLCIQNTSLFFLFCSHSDMIGVYGIAMFFSFK